MNVGYSKQFVEHIGFSHRPHQKLDNAIGDYIEKALDDTRTPTMLSAASVNNMAKLVEDQRVREFTSEDRKPIIEWLQLGLEQMKIQQVCEVMVMRKIYAFSLKETKSRSSHMLAQVRRFVSVTLRKSIENLWSIRQFNSSLRRPRSSKLRGYK